MTKFLQDSESVEREELHSSFGMIELNSVIFRTIKVLLPVWINWWRILWGNSSLANHILPPATDFWNNQLGHSCTHCANQTKVLFTVLILFVCFCLGLGTSGTDECLSVSALYIETGDTDSNPYTCHYPVKVCVSQFTLKSPFRSLTWSRFNSCRLP